MADIQFALTASREIAQTGRDRAKGEQGLEAFIIRYGFVAILLGTAIEGEPFALAGGVLAQRAMLPFWIALGAAFAGALLIDQLWFHAARRVRTNHLVQTVTRRPAFARSLASLDRHPVWFVLLSRFVYGIRAVASVAIGFSPVRTRLFMPLNVLAAAVWSVLFTALGYWSGPIFEQLSTRYGAGVEAAAVVLSLTMFAVALRGGRANL